MIMLIATGLGLLGAFFGSFACAQVWRLRARQLVEDKAQGEKVGKKELIRLKGLIRPISRDRSECLRCHRTLAWYDLVPIVSWLSLGGKCRYCKKSIGSVEVLTEIGLGLVFALSYVFWPLPLDTLLSWAQFALWLAACVLMTILFVYDAKWFLLPFSINLALIAIGALYALVNNFQIGISGETALSLLVAILLLPGLYFGFSLFGWVGMGDGILGLGLALLLGKWEYALLALFLSNLLGCLALIPFAMRGKLRRQMHIPFGPFLILATIITMLWGSELIGLFLHTMGLSLVALVV